ncbi:integrase core domain-containing protein [Rhodococcus sp. NPDC058521]|uniref:integrase core domain-containing protein n=1 Tax=Rhodococcus sp. NPDC058521 TaxID=3346536 RepID=UPI00365FC736
MAIDGAVGTSADNALAESFNAALKCETLQDRNRWTNGGECRREVFRWLTRYNTVVATRTAGTSAPPPPRTASPPVTSMRPRSQNSPVSNIRGQGPLSADPGDRIRRKVLIRTRRCRSHEGDHNPSTC